MTGRMQILFSGMTFALALAFVSPVGAQESWKGTVKQNSGSSNYTVVMTLTGNGGETLYPELKCGGKLTRVGQSGAYSFYLEKITTPGSSCIDGAITLVRSDGMIAWGWVGAHKGQTYVGWSSLARQ